MFDNLPSLPAFEWSKALFTPFRLLWRLENRFQPREVRDLPRLATVQRDLRADDLVASLSLRLYSGNWANST